MFSHGRFEGVPPSPHPSIAENSSPETPTTTPHTDSILLDYAPTAIAASPASQPTFVAVAGRELLRVLRITLDSIQDVIDLRASVFGGSGGAVVHPGVVGLAGGAGRYRATFACSDVAWLRDGKIATAANNGAVVMWDIENPAGQFGTYVDRVMMEHSMAVNSVCGVPGGGDLILSASQDRTMKLWDIRDEGKSVATFEGKSEAVRCVQFNPVSAFTFAASFDNGLIQTWDIRQPKIYQRKAPAHDSAVFTLDWHSNGHTLATGGRDKRIKVWEVSRTEGRPVLLHTIPIMSSIACVRWRPDRPSELACSALMSDSRVHVYDVNRPYLAKYYIQEHDNVIAGFHWAGTDELWTCAKDRRFARTTRSHFRRQIDSLNVSCADWNVFGELAFAVDTKNRNQGMRSGSPMFSPSSMKNSTPDSMPMLPGVRPGRFPIPTLPHKQQAGIALFPGFDHVAFRHFAEHYTIKPNRIRQACENNANAACEIRHYRTAQTWKLIQLFFVPDDSPADFGNEFQQQQRIRSETAPPAINLSSMLRESETSQPPRSMHQTKKNSQVVPMMPKETPCLEWHGDKFIDEVLEYYADAGDVQFCSTLLMVLNGRVKRDYPFAREWFESYIDLLRSFKLYSAATAMLNACPVPSVREMNLSSTTICTTCNNCFRPIVNESGAPFYTCDRCRKPLNPCSICHSAVRGLYTWCQGCSHGGHMEHMREWFYDNVECPTGCGHKCTLAPMAPADFGNLFDIPDV